MTDVTVDLNPTVVSASVVPPAPIVVDVNSQSPVIVDFQVSSMAVNIVTAEIDIALSLVGQPGPPGATEILTIDRVTGQPLSGHKLVTVLDDGTVGYADSATFDHRNRPIWLTTAAWMSGVTATLVKVGPVVEPTWAWQVGVPVWLGLGGALTQDISPSGVFVRRVAEVISPTEIIFDPHQPIALISEPLGGYAGYGGYNGPLNGGYSGGYSAGY